MAINPQTIPVTDIAPGDRYPNDAMGIVAELRLISFLLAQGFGITDDLDQLRHQLTPINHKENHHDNSRRCRIGH